MGIARSHRLFAALVVTVLATTALWQTIHHDAGPTGADRASIAIEPGATNLVPAPRATSPAQLAATLRAGGGPPPPELLRDNPQAQAAYDASAQPGDFVTPPAVSVEH